VLYWRVWPHATQALGYSVENKTYCCVRQPRLPSLAFPRHRESQGSGRGWSLSHGGTGMSCPGSYSAYPRGNLLWRLLGSLLLHRRAATPQFLQSFLSGHHWLTHNWYRRRNQAVLPLFCALWLLEAFLMLEGMCPFTSFCLLQSLLQEVFPSVLRKRRQRRWDRS